MAIVSISMYSFPILPKFHDWLLLIYTYTYTYIYLIEVSEHFSDWLRNESVSHRELWNTNFSKRNEMRDSPAGSSLAFTSDQGTNVGG